VACEKGHLETAQWVWSLGCVDHHARDDYAFRSACNNGDLETGRWLISLDPEFEWPNESLRKLQVVSDARYAWMVAVVCNCHSIPR